MGVYTYISLNMCIYIHLCSSKGLEVRHPNNNEHIQDDPNFGF